MTGLVKIGNTVVPRSSVIVERFIGRVPEPKTKKKFNNKEQACTYVHIYTKYPSSKSQALAVDMR